MVTIVSNTVLHIWKLLRGWILKVLIRGKKLYLWWWRLTRFVVVSVSQYLQISNHFVVYMKLIECYVSLIPNFFLKKENILHSMNELHYHPSWVSGIKSMYITIHRLLHKLLLLHRFGCRVGGNKVFLHCHLKIYAIF